MCHKKKLKFRDYKNCLKASQIENKINHLEKKKILKEDKKELLKKTIIKTQQRFKIEGYDVFTEIINKFALSSCDDKRMQSIDSIETYPYGISKDLKCKKEKIKGNSIIKQYKNV